MNKICSKCGEEKELKLFNKAKWCSGGVRPECKKCEAKARSERQRVQKKVDPDARYGVVLKNKYGITFEVYKLMLEDQGNACAICRKTTPGMGKRYFSVDHCHKTGRIRGLLCQKCNAGLGMYSDQIEFLEKAILYLRGEL